MKKKVLCLFGVFYLSGLIVVAQITPSEENATTPYEEIVKDQTPLTSEELPPQVSGSFENRFPHNDHPVWTREGENYSANYEREGKTIRSEFSPEGIWRGDYSRIERDELPLKIKNYIENNLQDQEIKELYETEKEEGRGYELYILEGSEETILVFDKEGNILKRGNEAQLENLR